MHKLLEKLQRGGNVDSPEEAMLVYKNIYSQSETAGTLQRTLNEVLDQQHDMNFLTEEAVKTVIGLKQSIANLGGQMSTPAGNAVLASMGSKVPPQPSASSSEAFQRLEKVFQATKLRSPESSTSSLASNLSKPSFPEAPSPFPPNSDHIDLQQIVYKITSQLNPSSTASSVSSAAPVQSAASQTAARAASNVSSSASGSGPGPRQPYGQSMSPEELKAAVERIKKQYDNSSGSKP